MNAQIRYGLASLCAAVLFGLATVVIGQTTDAVAPLTIASWGLVLTFVGGFVLLIVGLVRRPRRS